MTAGASSALVIALGGAAIAGCGGGMPLLHPAQVLDAGEVRASAGFSAQVATGGLSDALHEATSPPPPGGGMPATTDARVKGILVAASIGPGLAPFAGARVGLGNGFEGGLAYTGRAARVDARRAFDLAPHWSLSLGAGGSAALTGRQTDAAVPDLDLTGLRGWGADVPVLVGYASDGDLYEVWVGARGGWEHAAIDALPVASQLGVILPMPATVSLSATRFWAGGLLGLAVGFRHMHVALELDAAYANVSGDYAGRHAELSGMTLAPAGSAWWAF